MQRYEFLSLRGFDEERCRIIAETYNLNDGYAGFPLLETLLGSL